MSMHGRLVRGGVVAALVLAVSPVLMSCNYVSPCTRAPLPDKSITDAVAAGGYGLEVNVDENGQAVPESAADERTDTVECDLVPGARPYWSEETA